jgi:hypothetical protein
VDADSSRSGAVVKVNRDRVRDLLLQISEVLPSRGDATRSIGIVPRCHEPARLLVTLDLQRDFFHYLEPIIPPPAFSRPVDPAKMAVMSPRKARSPCQYVSFLAQ